MITTVGTVGEIFPTRMKVGVISITGDEATKSLNCGDSQHG